MGDTSGGHGPPKNRDEDDMSLSELAKQIEDPPQNGDQVKSHIDFENKYASSDRSPFIVFVEHDEKNVGRLFPVRVGHYILGCDREIADSVIDIRIVGVNRVKVIMKNYSAANALVNNQVLKSHKLSAYIPKFFTQKKGVVKMVDTFFSEEYLLKSIESKFRVVEVKRMTRRTKDPNTGEEKTVSRQMIVVSFMGNELPQEIRINKVNFPVEPYVHPVIQCRLCLRFGHTDRLCRGKARCKTCAIVHDATECENITLCANCGSKEHKSLSRNCPAYLQQKSIKEVMAHKNVSFREAEQLVKNPSYAKTVNNNRFSILNNYTIFPELPTPKPANYDASGAANKSSPSNTHKRPSQGSDLGNSRKRKPSFSPQRIRKKDSRSTPRESQPIIPNPYRSEFLEYRDSLINQLATFVEDLITSYFHDPTVVHTFKNINIKDSISKFLDNHNDSMDCDALSELSSY